MNEIIRRKEKILPYYESVFIARQDISPTQVDGLADAFEKIILDAGGSIAKRESWGLRTMAYKINKNRKGHYVLLNMEAPATALHEMERQMRINEDILRYLNIRLDEQEKSPSVMMRNKERHDRPRQDRDPGRENNLPPPAPELEKSTDDKLPDTSADAEHKPMGDET